MPLVRRLMQVNSQAKTCTLRGYRPCFPQLPKDSDEFPGFILTPQILRGFKKNRECRSGI